MDRVYSGGLAACEGSWWYRMWAFFPKLPPESLALSISTSLNQFILPMHGITHIARLPK